MAISAPAGREAVAFRGQPRPDPVMGNRSSEDIDVGSALRRLAQGALAPLALVAAGHLPEPRRGRALTRQRRFRSESPLFEAAS
jgi:hypothetical protein